MAIAKVEEALRKILGNAATVKAIVVDRIDPMVLRQGRALPALVYQKISGPRVHSHQGASGAASPRIQIRAWAKEYGEAKLLAEAVRLVLDGKTFEDYDVGDGRLVTIQSILAEDEQDLYDEATRAYGTSVDYIVWHNEEIPV